VVQMLLVDLTMAGVGLMVFPLVTAATLTYQHFSSPLFTQIQALRAELSEVAHESFDGAMVVKTLGREAEETERFAEKALQLRDLGIRVGRIRAVFDPLLEAIPSLGVLGVLGVGVLQIQHGNAGAGDVVTIAYLLTIVAFPIRSIGWLLGEFPRSVVGFGRVQRVLQEPIQTEYGDGELSSTGRGARLEVDGVDFSYAPEQVLLRELRFVVEPGTTVAVVGETASGKSTLTTLLTRLVDPLAGRSTESTCATLAPDSWPARSLWSRSRHSSSTTPSAATSPSVKASATTMSGLPCGSLRQTASSLRYPMRWTRVLVSVAPPFRAGSGSGSRWRGRWYDVRDC
jgi:ATP-binding cassette subfamily B protein